MIAGTFGGGRRDKKPAAASPGESFERLLLPLDLRLLDLAACEKRDQREDQKNHEEDLGDPSEGSGHAGKAKNGRYKGHDEEENCVL